MTSLEETIIKMITYQLSKQVMRKIIKEEPEIVTVGFYKECRKRGIYLHARFGNYPVIPDSSIGGEK